MTQFLLVESNNPPELPGFRVSPADGDEFLAIVAAATFPGHHVWVVRPADGEIDQAIDRARNDLRAGSSYGDTEIAAILSKVLSVARGLALFWASYPNDLPVAVTREEVHRIVENDLRADQMGEVYVCWRPT